jgi:hypothetical protein
MFVIFQPVQSNFNCAGMWSRRDRSVNHSGDNFSRSRYAVSTKGVMRHNRIERDQIAVPEPTTIWSRAFDEVQRARDAGATPNPEVFRDLTKSAAGD